MQILFAVIEPLSLRESSDGLKGSWMLQELTILTSLRLVPPLKRDRNWRKTLLERARLHLDARRINVRKR